MTKTEFRQYLKNRFGTDAYAKATHGTKIPSGTLQRVLSPSVNNFLGVERVEKLATVLGLDPRELQCLINPKILGAHKHLSKYSRFAATGTKAVMI